MDTFYSVFEVLSEVNEPELWASGTAGMDSFYNLFCCMIHFILAKTVTHSLVIYTVVDIQGISKESHVL